MSKELFCHDHLSVWKLFIAMFCFRTIPIDPRFYVTHHKINVLDVKWHPGSQADIHLMVLTSDNNLRYCEAELINMTIFKASPVMSSYSLTIRFSFARDMSQVIRGGVGYEGMVNFFLEMDTII